MAAIRIGALILSVTAAFGQMNTGEIGGTVKDSSGGWVPGATVVAEQSATRLRYTAVANNSGEYLLPQLPIGTYNVTVDAQGFKRSVLLNLEVHVGDKLRHEFTLEVGDRNEVIIVEASVGPLQLESAEIKDVIQHEQVIALPLKARQFLDLKLQFRVEAYNLLNHPNFNIPSRSAFTSTFGKIGSAQDARQLQFAMRLTF